MSDQQTNRYVMAVLGLTKLTQEGKLQWASQGPAGKLTGGRIESSYYARESNRRLRLTFTASATTGVPADPADLVAEIVSAHFSRTRLEIVDESGVTLFEFPYSAAIEQLLSAVKVQLAGVADFLTNVIEKAI